MQDHPVELRILVFADRNGRATVRLAGNGVPHHRIPANEARREISPSTTSAACAPPVAARSTTS